jgi:hypothetical protein
MNPEGGVGPVLEVVKLVLPDCVMLGKVRVTGLVPVLVSTGGIAILVPVGVLRTLRMRPLSPMKRPSALSTATPWGLASMALVAG